MSNNFTSFVQQNPLRDYTSFFNVKPQQATYLNCLVIRVTHITIRFQTVYLCAIRRVQLNVCMFSCNGFDLMFLHAVFGVSNVT